MTAPLPIQLSDNAARQIAARATRQPQPGAMLRIAVEGGGCSGFQYTYTFVWQQEDDDLVLEKNGVKVLIDSTSQTLMEGTLIDFEESLGSASFVIKNPNATARCGCGNSFSV